MRLFAHKHRPVHLGSYPLERLARLASPTAQPPGLNGQVLERPSEGSEGGPVGMGHAFDPYIKLFDGLRTGTVAPVRAPIPDDPDEIATNIKAGIYFLWAAIKLPFARAKLAAWDDKVGHGSINPVKKWWWDLEWVDGQTREPAKGTNARDLDFNRARRAETQQLALYPAEVMPPPHAKNPVPLNRKAGLEHAAQAASPAQARLRFRQRQTSRVSEKRPGA